MYVLMMKGVDKRKKSELNHLDPSGGWIGLDWIGLVVKADEGGTWNMWVCPEMEQNMEG